MVANVCFGGPKRNRLFICATTSVYSLLNVNGSRPDRGHDLAAVTCARRCASGRVMQLAEERGGPCPCLARAVDVAGPVQPVSEVGERVGLVVDVAAVLVELDRLLIQLDRLRRIRPLEVEVAEAVQGGGETTVVASSLNIQRLLAAGERLVVLAQLGMAQPPPLRATACCSGRSSNA